MPSQKRFQLPLTDTTTNSYSTIKVLAEMLRLSFKFPSAAHQMTKQ
jgi:hypothetical protein